MAQFLIRAAVCLALSLSACGQDNPVGRSASGDGENLAGQGDAPVPGDGEGQAEPGSKEDVAPRADRGEPAEEADGFELAFVSSDGPGGSGDIFLASLDGSSLFNLTNQREKYGPLFWSPDGSKIAFWSEGDPHVRGGNIYVMGIDGSGRKRMSDRSGHRTLIGWTADGLRLLFAQTLWNEEDTCAQIMSMDLEGGNLVELTGCPHYNQFPVLSGDRSLLAFVRRPYRHREAGLYAMGSEGGTARQLMSYASSTGLGGHSWSPDGSRIAFHQKMGPGQRIEMAEGPVFFHPEETDVGVIDVDSGERVNLTNRHEAADEWPVWSPSGDEIAFVSQRDGNREVYVMNADGSGAINLSFHPAEDFGPKWSPDGYTVAFVRSKGTGHGLFAVQAAGGSPYELIDSAGPIAAFFAWAPPRK